MGTDSGTKQNGNAYNTASNNYGNNNNGTFGLMGDGGFGNLTNTGTVQTAYQSPNYSSYPSFAGQMAQSGAVNPTQNYQSSNGPYSFAMYSESAPWLDSSSGQWGQFNNGYNSADYTASNDNTWRNTVLNNVGNYVQNAQGTGYMSSAEGAQYAPGLESYRTSESGVPGTVNNAYSTSNYAVQPAGNTDLTAAGNPTVNTAANGTAPTLTNTASGVSYPSQAYYNSGDEDSPMFMDENGNFDISNSIWAPSYYEGQTVADLAPETLAGWDAMTQRALNGSDVVNQAKNQTMQTLGGAYMQSPVQNSAENFINNAQTTPGFLSQYNPSIRPELNNYNANASQVDLNRLRQAEAAQADLDQLARAQADKIDWNRIGDSQARASSVNLNNLKQVEAAQADTAQFNDIAQAQAAQARENAGQYNLNNVAMANAAQAAINPWLQDNNDYLDAMVDRAQKQTLSATNSAFSRNGRYGSGAHEAAAFDAANNLANQMYGEQYNQDRNRSLEAWNNYNNALLQNAQLQNAVNLQNASQYNTAGLQNAQTAAQIALQNAQLQNTTNLNNMSQWNAAGLQNAQMANDINQYNANLATNASIQNAANYLAGAQTNAQLGTQASIANANNAAQLAQYDAQLGTQASIANANNAAEIARNNANLATQASIQNASNYLSGANQNANLGTQTALQNSQIASNLADNAAQRDLNAWQQYQNNLLSGYNTNMSAGLTSQGLLQDAYQNERNNQLQASQLAPTLAAEDYNDIDNLLGVGKQIQDYNQEIYNSIIDRYNYDVSMPMNALNNVKNFYGWQ